QRTPRWRLGFMPDVRGAGSLIRDVLPLRKATCSLLPTSCCVRTLGIFDSYSACAPGIGLTTNSRSHTASIGDEAAEHPVGANRALRFGQCSWLFVRSLTRSVRRLQQLRHLRISRPIIRPRLLDAVQVLFVGTRSGLG